MEVTGRLHPLLRYSIQMSPFPLGTVFSALMFAVGWCGGGGALRRVQGFIQGDSDHFTLLPTRGRCVQRALRAVRILQSADPLKQG